ncbi:hypothetical protein AX15_007266 [Amanita polypyramis BW_CC]|nr:hypothetical protein AX15_007266 [Amanita polypyramis BW_CC]
MELACSPFHVRFGKWKVLRPSDKRVNVSVNGNLIPFNMKIGDAGEAFFVFETDDDVPEDLITSPILQPIRSEAEVIATQTNDEDQGIRPRVTSEPEYFDLDAVPGVEDKALEPAHDTPRYTQAHSKVSIEQDVRSPSIVEQDQRVDEILGTRLEGIVTGPSVKYHKDVVLDIEGYYAPKRSDQTPKNSLAFPSSFEHDSSNPSPNSSQVPHADPSLLPSSPTRANSEPPPDNLLTAGHGPSHASSFDVVPKSSMTSPGPSSPSPTPPLLHLHSMQRHQQEYSWEWGAFPTPSPFKTVFLSGKGKEKAQAPGDGPSKSYFDTTEEEGAEADNENDGTEGKLRGRRRRKSQNKHKLDNDVDLAALGAGRIRADETDPARCILEIEGQQIGFELGIVDEKSISATGHHSFHDLETMEATRLFDQARVPFRAFLDDETIVKDEGLIIRWAGCRYTTRKDKSSIMFALEEWRAVALHQRQPDGSVANAVAVPRTEGFRQPHSRSKSEPPEEMRSAATAAAAGIDETSAKPSKLSWVPWWRRNRMNSGYNGDVKERPALVGSVSAPPTMSSLRQEPKAPMPELQQASEPVVPTTPRRQQFITSRKKYVKALRLTSDQLKSLDLKPGTNTITFSLSASGVIACTARIFVWEHTDQIVISDIDGTITKSDGLGHVFAMIGRDWTHLGVAKLYTDITRNGYKILYLTSRAIGQADATRYYLKGIKQNDYQLPEGPVVMSPDRLMASLHREVIMRKPEVFKMACLRDIRNLFGGPARNPFYAGFGNRITDALSYRSVNVSSSHIFTIDSSGEVKLELLELAGYKSSYIHMTDLVDQMFPPIHRKWTPEYTDFNFWRTPIPDIPLPDLVPPSPALSARSDGSTKSALARLRHFSLGGSRQGNALKDDVTSDDLRKNLHLRQMSSFERLSTSLVDGLRRSISPDSRSESSGTYAESEPDSDGGEWEIGGDGKRKRERRKSIGSMPGSLDDMHFFGMDEYEEEEPQFEGRKADQDGNGDLQEEDFADEQALEEDLFVADEMKNVPFL